MNNLRRILKEETAGLHPSLLLAQFILAILPPYTGGRLRTLVLRSIGFSIGNGTQFWDTPAILGNGNIYQRLVIGEDCLISIACFIDLASKITLGDRVGVGPHCMLLTGDHDYGDDQNRVGQLAPLPIHVGDGTWLGARSLILPGVTIGKGAVIAAGAIVTKDVPPNTVVAGIPAKVIRYLQPSNELKGVEFQQTVLG
jgi:maltose O-acetyltransferase